MSVYLLEHGRALHRDLDKLDPGSKSSKPRFNKTKCGSCTLATTPAALQAGDRVAGQQPGRKGSRGTDGHQAGHEPAVCPGGQEGQMHLACISNSVVSRSRQSFSPCAQH